MRAGVLLIVAVLHGGALLALWSVQQRKGATAARHELAVRLLPAVTAPAVPTQRAAPPALTLPSFAPIAPPAFDVQAETRPEPAAAPSAAAPEQVVFASSAAPHDEARVAEPALQSARRAACAPAPHPLVLRERGVEGVVRLRVWVDELGRAGQVLLAASSGWRLFDDAAVAQARRCPFHPALRGTQPVGSWVEFPVRFALETSNG